MEKMIDLSVHMMIEEGMHKILKARAQANRRGLNNEIYVILRDVLNKETASRKEDRYEAIKKDE